MSAESFPCAQCQASLRRPPQLLAGASIQCPRCKTVQQVPAPVPMALPVEAPPSPADDLASLGRMSGKGPSRRRPPTTNVAAKLIVGLGGGAILLLGCVLAVLFNPFADNPKPSTIASNPPPTVTTPKPTRPTPPPTTAKEPTPLPDPPLGGGLPGEVLAKVKNATVRLRVRLADQTEATGSGFFAVQPNLILTNAHVLGMLDPDDPPPFRVEAILASGEEDERTRDTTVVGVDPDSDLAILRLDPVKPGDPPSKPPPPLTLASARGLQEMQPVFVVGFPFGELPGKNITVSQTTVSSLRKGADGELSDIQVNGGMHPGNSGGPVVDGRGNVIGVAVAIIRNTQIHVAIPGDTVARVLDGRITAVTLGDATRKDDKLLLPLTVTKVDPLGRLTRMSLDWWAGPIGLARPAAKDPPTPLDGDGPRSNVALKRQADGAVADVLAPALPPGKVLWVQPRYNDAEDKPRWGVATMLQPDLIIDPKPTTVTVKPPAGTDAVELSSQARLLIQTEDDQGFAASALFTARLLETTGEPSTLSVRFPPPAADDPPPLRWQTLIGSAIAPTANDLTRINAALAKQTLEAEVSAEKGWEWKKFNAAGVDREVRSVATDMVEQLQATLAALTPTPPEKLDPNQTWETKRTLPVRLLGVMKETATLELTFTYRGLSGDDEAYLGVSGELGSAEGRTFKATGDVSGWCRLNLKTGRLRSASLTVRPELLFLLQGNPARAVGQIVLRLQRVAGETMPTAVASEALRGTWQVVKAEHDGKPMFAANVKAEVKIGPKLFQLVGPERTLDWNYRVDELRRPKGITLFPSDNPEIASPGIWLKEGDTLALCFPRREGQRPTAFATRSGSDLVLLILKRTMANP